MIPMSKAMRSTVRMMRISKMRTTSKMMRTSKMKIKNNRNLRKAKILKNER